MMSSDMNAPGAGPQLPHGGPVTGGATYLVGERGPELFTPIVSGAIIPNLKLGKGAAAPVINIINQAGGGVEVEHQAPRIDAGQWITDIVLKKGKADPGFRMALSQIVNGR